MVYDKAIEKCPFCGYTATMKEMPYYKMTSLHKRFWVQCDNVGCEAIIGRGTYNNENMTAEAAMDCAATQWNLRDAGSRFPQ